MKSLSEDNLMVSCIDKIFLFTLSQNLLLTFKILISFIIGEVKNVTLYRVIFQA
jgi:hypothetical protein